MITIRLQILQCFFNSRKRAEDASHDHEEKREKYDWGNNNIRVTVSVPKSVQDSKTNDKQIEGIDVQSIWHLLNRLSTDGVPLRASFTHPTNGDLEAVAIFKPDSMRWANKRTRSQFCCQLTMEEMRQMLEAKFGKNYKESKEYQEAEKAANKEMQQYRQKQKEKS